MVLTDSPPAQSATILGRASRLAAAPVGLLRVSAGAACRVAIIAALAAPSAAHAQTTVVLDSPGTEVTDDTTIRGGAYASTNFSTATTLETKNSSDSSNVRHILLKFATGGVVPQGTILTKAELRLTLKASGTASPRTLGVYWVSRSFLKDETTWYSYRRTSSWTAYGGDFGQRFTSFSIGRTPGTRVSVDVTPLVQQAINGSFGTRYTRIGLVDVSPADVESLRVFYSSRASDPSVRPALVLTYGTATAGISAASSSTTPLTVMTYNTHHGVGTDGQYNLDRIATVIANARPDVVGLNEVMYNSSYGAGENQPETYRRLLQQKTGQTWYYVYARMDGNWTSTSWSTGNQLLSRFPFVTTTRYELISGQRSVAQGTIVVNGRTVNLFSTHVSWDSATSRMAETDNVRNWAATWAENRVVMGDFNTSPGSTEYGIMASAYSDTWVGGVKAGIASSPSGSSGYTHGGSRFDYVYRSLGATSLVLSGIVVPNTSVGGVKPSDHDPVVATFMVQ